jgi:hypothetical protein
VAFFGDGSGGAVAMITRECCRVIAEVFHAANGGITSSSNLSFSEQAHSLHKRLLVFNRVECERANGSVSVQRYLIFVSILVAEVTPRKSFTLSLDDRRDRAALNLRTQRR